MEKKDPSSHHHPSNNQQQQYLLKADDCYPTIMSSGFEIHTGLTGGDGSSSSSLFDMSFDQKGFMDLFNLEDHYDFTSLSSSLLDLVCHLPPPIPIELVFYMPTGHMEKASSTHFTIDLVFMEMAAVPDGGGYGGMRARFHMRESSPEITSHRRCKRVA
ncbi:hypothetical protein SAY86_012936 [Trapa natans]|uniref:Uncharacterized protein n=1 Tax=Trapa natans TaxID=22666 RepID=A0AAN7R9N0_TRANT|nr:hypothetical protein SAY86_012936 [Trapa natans]